MDSQPWIGRDPRAAYFDAATDEHRDAHRHGHRAGRVPVLFSLGGWDPSSLVLRDWMIPRLLRDHSFLDAEAVSRVSIEGAHRPQHGTPSKRRTTAFGAPAGLDEVT